MSLVSVIFPVLVNSKSKSSPIWNISPTLLQFTPINFREAGDFSKEKHLLLSFLSKGQETTSPTKWIVFKVQKSGLEFLCWHHFSNLNWLIFDSTCQCVSKLKSNLLRLGPISIELSISVSSNLKLKYLRQKLIFHRHFFVKDFLQKRHTFSINMSLISRYVGTNCTYVL